jgi:hypothetical protein
MNSISWFSSAIELAPRGLEIREEVMIDSDPAVISQPYVAILA